MPAQRLPHKKNYGPKSLGRWFAIRSASGYTLVEIAIVVTIIGLIAALSIGTYSGALGNSDIKTASATGENIAGAILAFARLNNRLPCPDINGDGREGDAAGACPAGREVGFIPYETLGLNNPPTIERGVYGVYRNAGIAADLVVPSVTLTRSNFKRAIAAGSIPAVTAAHVFITGNNASTGAENCTSTRVFHPAFVVIIPGADRDGNGNNLDGIHAGLPGTGLCIASPDRVPNTVFDDRVVSTGFTTLLGLISADAP
jgi:prepilin-type N-terminal cleavage/methylation domain-containing protein